MTPFAIGTIYNRNGNLHLLQSQNKEADSFYSKAIEQFDLISSDIEKAKTHNNLGILYGREGDYEKAKHYTISSNKLFKKMNQEQYYLINSGNVVKYYNDNYEYDKSIKLIDVIEAKFIELNLLVELGQIYSHRAYIELKKGNYAKSKEFYQKSKEQSQSHNKNENIFYAEVALARIAAYQNDLIKAREYFEKAKIAVKECDTEITKTEMIFLEAELYEHEGNIEKTKEKYDEALKIFLEIDILGRQDILIKYGKFLSKIG